MDEPSDLGSGTGRKDSPYPGYRCLGHELQGNVAVEARALGFPGTPLCMIAGREDDTKRIAVALPATGTLRRPWLDLHRTGLSRRATTRIADDDLSDRRVLLAFS